MTYQEAEDYAKRLREDVNIMLDETTDEYHVIRAYAVDHWKQHYANIAEVRVVSEVTLL